MSRNRDGVYLPAAAAQEPLQQQNPIVNFPAGQQRGTLRQWASHQLQRQGNSTLPLRMEAAGKEVLVLQQQMQNARGSGRIQQQQRVEVTGSHDLRQQHCRTQQVQLEQQQSQTAACVSYSGKECTANGFAPPASEAASNPGAGVGSRRTVKAATGRVKAVATPLPSGLVPLCTTRYRQPAASPPGSSKRMSRRSISISSSRRFSSSSSVTSNCSINSYSQQNYSSRDHGEKGAASGSRLTTVATPRLHTRMQSASTNPSSEVEVASRSLGSQGYVNAPVTVVPERSDISPSAPAASLAMAYPGFRNTAPGHVEPFPTAVYPSLSLESSVLRQQQVLQHQNTLRYHCCTPAPNRGNITSPCINGASISIPPQAFIVGASTFSSAPIPVVGNTSGAGHPVPAVQLGTSPIAPSTGATTILFPSPQVQRIQAALSPSTVAVGSFTSPNMSACAQQQQNQQQKRLPEYSTASPLQILGEISSQKHAAITQQQQNQRTQVLEPCQVVNGALHQSHADPGVHQFYVQQQGQQQQHTQTTAAPLNTQGKEQQDVLQHQQVREAAEGAAAPSMMVALQGLSAYTFPSTPEARQQQWRQQQGQQQQEQQDSGQQHQQEQQEREREQQEQQKWEQHEQVQQVRDQYQQEQQHPHQEPHQQQQEHQHHQQQQEQRQHQRRPSDPMLAQLHQATGTMTWEQQVYHHGGVDWNQQQHYLAYTHAQEQGLNGRRLQQYKHQQLDRRVQYPYNGTPSSPENEDSEGPYSKAGEWHVLPSEHEWTFAPHTPAISMKPHLCGEGDDDDGRFPAGRESASLAETTGISQFFIPSNRMAPGTAAAAAGAGAWMEIAPPLHKISLRHLFPFPHCNRRMSSSNCENADYVTVRERDGFTLYPVEAHSPAVPITATRTTDIPGQACNRNFAQTIADTGEVTLVAQQQPCAGTTSSGVPIRHTASSLTAAASVCSTAPTLTSSADVLRCSSFAKPEERANISCQPAVFSAIAAEDINTRTATAESRSIVTPARLGEEEAGRKMRTANTAPSQDSIPSATSVGAGRRRTAERESRDAMSLTLTRESERRRIAEGGATAEEVVVGMNAVERSTRRERDITFEEAAATITTTEERMSNKSSLPQIEQGGCIEITPLISVYNSEKTENISVAKEKCCSSSTSRGSAAMEEQCHTEDLVQSENAFRYMKHSEKAEERDSKALEFALNYPSMAGRTETTLPAPAARAAPAEVSATIVTGELLPVDMRSPTKEDKRGYASSSWNSATGYAATRAATSPLPQVEGYTSISASLYRYEKQDKPVPAAKRNSNNSKDEAVISASYTPSIYLDNLSKTATTTSPTLAPVAVSSTAAAAAVGRSFASAGATTANASVSAAADASTNAILAVPPICTSLGPGKANAAATRSLSSDTLPSPQSSVQISHHPQQKKQQPQQKKQQQLLAKQQQQQQIFLLEKKRQHKSRRERQYEHNHDNNTSCHSQQQQKDSKSILFLQSTLLAGTGNSNTGGMGQYFFGGTLGEGTFGKVKLGIHAATQEAVAIKILDKKKIQEANDVERVIREIHILKTLRHPHIVQLLEIIETQRHLYLVMEYAPGGELYDYIVERQQVEERQACSFFRQILAGVEEMHKLRICHRDLKPENILLDEFKNIKIVDFGLSNTYTNNNSLLTTACGSPSYAAPEMIEGKAYEPLMVDIWSCGVILFTLLAGYLPFESSTTDGLYKKIMKGIFECPNWISSGAKHLIHNILKTDPSRRYNIRNIKEHPWYNMPHVRVGVPLLPLPYAKLAAAAAVVAAAHAVPSETAAAGYASNRCGTNPRRRSSNSSSSKDGNCSNSSNSSGKNEEYLSFSTCGIAACSCCVQWTLCSPHRPLECVLQQMEKMGIDIEAAKEHLAAGEITPLTAAYILMVNRRHRVAPSKGCRNLLLPSQASPSSLLPASSLPCSRRPLPPTSSSTGVAASPAAHTATSGPSAAVAGASSSAAAASAASAALDKASESSAAAGAAGACSAAALVGAPVSSAATAAEAFTVASISPQHPVFDAAALPPALFPSGAATQLLSPYHFAAADISSSAIVHTTRALGVKGIPRYASSASDSEFCLSALASAAPPAPKYYTHHLPAARTATATDSSSPLLSTSFPYVGSAAKSAVTALPSPPAATATALPAATAAAAGALPATAAGMSLPTAVSGLRAAAATKPIPTEFAGAAVAAESAAVPSVAVAAAADPIGADVAAVSVEGAAGLTSPATALLPRSAPAAVFRPSHFRPVAYCAALLAAAGGRQGAAAPMPAATTVSVAKDGGHDIFPSGTTGLAAAQAPAAGEITAAAQRNAAAAGGYLTAPAGEDTLPAGENTIIAGDYIAAAAGCTSTENPASQGEHQTAVAGVYSVAARESTSVAKENAAAEGTLPATSCLSYPAAAAAGIAAAQAFAAEPATAAARIHTSRISVACPAEFAADVLFLKASGNKATARPLPQSTAAIGSLSPAPRRTAAAATLSSRAAAAAAAVVGAFCLSAATATATPQPMTTALTSSSAAPVHSSVVATAGAVTAFRRPVAADLSAEQALREEELLRGRATNMRRASYQNSDVEERATSALISSRYYSPGDIMQMKSSDSATGRRICTQGKELTHLTGFADSRNDPKNSRSKSSRSKSIRSKSSRSRSFSSSCVSSDIAGSSCFSTSTMTTTASAAASRLCSAAERMTAATATATATATAAEGKIRTLRSVRVTAAQKAFSRTHAASSTSPSSRAAVLNNAAAVCSAAGGKDAAATSGGTPAAAATAAAAVDSAPRVPDPAVLTLADGICSAAPAGDKVAVCSSAAATKTAAAAAGAAAAVDGAMPAASILTKSTNSAMAAASRTTSRSAASPSFLSRNPEAKRQQVHRGKLHLHLPLQKLQQIQQQQQQQQQATAAGFYTYRSPPRVAAATARQCCNSHIDEKLLPLSARLCSRRGCGAHAYIAVGAAQSTAAKASSTEATAASWKTARAAAGVKAATTAEAAIINPTAARKVASKCPAGTAAEDAAAEGRGREIPRTARDVISTTAGGGECGGGTAAATDSKPVRTTSLAVGSNTKSQAAAAADVGNDNTRHSSTLKKVALFSARCTRKGGTETSAKKAAEFTGRHPTTARGLTSHRAAAIAATAAPPAAPPAEVEVTAAGEGATAGEAAVAAAAIAEGVEQGAAAETATAVNESRAAASSQREATGPVTTTVTAAGCQALHKGRVEELVETDKAEVKILSSREEAAADQAQASRRGDARVLRLQRPLYAAYAAGKCRAATVSPHTTPGRTTLLPTARTIAATAGATGATGAAGATAKRPTTTVTRIAAAAAAAEKKRGGATAAIAEATAAFLSAASGTVSAGNGTSISRTRTGRGNKAAAAALAATTTRAKTAGRVLVATARTRAAAADGEKLGTKDSKRNPRLSNGRRVPATARGEYLRNMKEQHSQGSRTARACLPDDLLDERLTRKANSNSSNSSSSTCSSSSSRDNSSINSSTCSSHVHSSNRKSSNDNNCNSRNQSCSSRKGSSYDIESVRTKDMCRSNTSNSHKESILDMKSIAIHSGNSLTVNGVSILGDGNSTTDSGEYLQHPAATSGAAHHPSAAAAADPVISRGGVPVVSAEDGTSVQAYILCGDAQTAATRIQTPSTSTNAATGVGNKERAEEAAGQKDIPYGCTASQTRTHVVQMPREHIKEGIGSTNERAAAAQTTLGPPLHHTYNIISSHPTSTAAPPAYLAPTGLRYCYTERQLLLSHAQNMEWRGVAASLPTREGVAAADYVHPASGSAHEPTAAATAAVSTAYTATRVSPFPVISSAAASSNASVAFCTGFPNISSPFFPVPATNMPQTAQVYHPTSSCYSSLLSNTTSNPAAAAIPYIRSVSPAPEGAYNTGGRNVPSFAGNCGMRKADEKKERQYYNVAYSPPSSAAVAAKQENQYITQHLLQRGDNIPGASNPPAAREPLLHSDQTSVTHSQLVIAETVLPRSYTSAVSTSLSNNSTAAPSAAVYGIASSHSRAPAVAAPLHSLSTKYSAHVHAVAAASSSFPSMDGQQTPPETTTTSAAASSSGKHDRESAVAANAASSSQQDIQSTVVGMSIARDTTMHVAAAARWPGAAAMTNEDTCDSAAKSVATTCAAAVAARPQSAYPTCLQTATHSSNGNSSNNSDNNDSTNMYSTDSSSAAYSNTSSNNAYSNNSSTDIYSNTRSKECLSTTEFRDEARTPNHLRSNSSCTDSRSSGACTSERGMYCYSSTNSTRSRSSSECLRSSSSMSSSSRYSSNNKDITDLRSSRKRERIFAAKKLPAGDIEGHRRPLTARAVLPFIQRRMQTCDAATLVRRKGRGLSGAAAEPVKYIPNRNVFIVQNVYQQMPQKIRQPQQHQTRVLHEQQQQILAHEQTLHHRDVQGHQENIPHEHQLQQISEQPERVPNRGYQGQQQIFQTSQVYPLQAQQQALQQQQQERVVSQQAQANTIQKYISVHGQDCHNRLQHDEQQHVRQEQDEQRRSALQQQQQRQQRLWRQQHLALVHQQQQHTRQERMLQQQQHHVAESVQQQQRQQTRMQQQPSSLPQQHYLLLQQHHRQLAGLESSNDECEERSSGAAVQRTSFSFHC